MRLSTVAIDGCYHLANDIMFRPTVVKTVSAAKAAIHYLVYTADHNVQNKKSELMLMRRATASV